MTELLSLWLPILLSALGVFFLSFLMWMVLPHHKADFHAFADTDRFLASVREQEIRPGVYMFPCSSEDWKTEEGKQRYKQGPWGVLSVHAGPANFGRNLAMVFLFYLVASLFVAYIAAASRAPGADFASVLQVAGTAGILAYAFGGIPHGIFFGRTFRAIAMDVLDGVAMGLLTGVIFALLWPSVAPAA